MAAHAVVLFARSTKARPRAGFRSVAHRHQGTVIESWDATAAELQQRAAFTDVAYSRAVDNLFARCTRCTRTVNERFFLGRVSKNKPRIRSTTACSEGPKEAGTGRKRRQNVKQYGRQLKESQSQLFRLPPGVRKTSEGFALKRTNSLNLRLTHVPATRHTSPPPLRRSFPFSCFPNPLPSASLNKLPLERRRRSRKFRQ